MPLPKTQFGKVSPYQHFGYLTPEGVVEWERLKKIETALASLLEAKKDDKK